MILLGENFLWHGASLRQIIAPGCYGINRLHRINSEGLPSQLSDIPGNIWDAFEEEKEVKAAWASAVGKAVQTSVVCTAKRNGLVCKLHFFPIPQEAVMITFSRWSPSSVLNDQELDVCVRSVAGTKPAVIAETLGITPQAVSKIKRSAMEKLRCETPEQLGSHFSVAEGLQF